MRSRELMVSILFCLQVLHCPLDHKAEYIRDLIEVTHADWNLDFAKLTAITTDNASNVNRAVAELGSELRNWYLVPCRPI